MRQGQAFAARHQGSVPASFTLLAAVIAVFASFILGSAAHAEPALTITPAEVAMSPGVPERILVTLSGTSAEISGTHLKLLAPPGLTAKSITPTRRARKTRGWIVTLEADGSLIASSASFLAQNRSALVAGSLKISPVAAPTADSQFTAELIYDGESLFDEAEGDLSLRLTNLSDTTLSLMPSVRLPGFLTAICGDGKPCVSPAHPLTLLPRASSVVKYRIAVNATEKHPLTTGKHQILAIVKATRLDGARPWQGSQIVTREVTVGIPGLGEVQALVQVPSFLLLPGFLICVVAAMVWRFWRPPPVADGAAGAWTAIAMSPPLWVAAVSLSMLVVWAYPHLSTLLGAGRRNLLQGFDLSDVIRVWVASIGIGFLAGNLAIAFDELRKWRTSRETFVSGDTPIEALRKMKRQNLSAFKVKMTNEVATGRLFLIADSSEAGKVWAFPAIRYEKVGEFEDAAFVEAIDTDQIGRVLGLAEKALRTQALQLQWDTTPGGIGPRLVDETLFNKPEQKGLIFDPA